MRQGSDGGRVRRILAEERTYAGRELGTLDPQGYMRVVLSKPGEKPRYRRMHQLILEAFVGPCPKGREACHDDDDKLNNTIPNLYWGTRGDNITDAYRNGRRIPAGFCAA